MESSILLLCKYGSFTLVVKVATSFRFEDFVGSIHRKWNELVSRRFNLLYVVFEHRNCVLENDDDFDNMLALATAYGVSCVEVCICVEEIQSSGCFDHGNSSGNGECRTVQILEDPLEKFCHRNETKWLSADWASLITHELCEVGGEKAKEFISFVSYDHWANAYFFGKRYGEMSSNAVESFNSWIREARKMPILQCVDEIRVQIMRQMYERKWLSRKWCSVVCPEMDLLLKNRFDKRKTWHVYGSNDEVFEVSSFPAVVVDIRNKSCTCCRWDIHSFPCVHAVTALQKIGVDMSQYIDPLYTIEAFRMSYDCPINPVPSLGAPEVTKETAIILPPKTRRPRGRPKVARIRSRGEKVRQIRCSRCQKLERHNRKSCKEPCD
ncbi:hypothetical protein Vadar_030594 [Vaccinium darrowii]|uniref:Uncharacterized protein n=1 Tax=Vaccinium darrowii TaxID=229202 RepID=A0ACB7Z8Q6_9ERIC|nr:hypothetical protein Vadar_030594 [Vaccinium darrowii]